MSQWSMSQVRRCFMFCTRAAFSDGSRRLGWGLAWSNKQMNTDATWHVRQVGHSVGTFLQGPVSSVGAAAPPWMEQLATPTMSNTFYSSSQTPGRRLVPVHVWLVCNSAADYYQVERAVASRLKGCPPPILRFSLSPQAGEVSRSRSHSVSRTGPNLLLFRLVTSAPTPCH